MRTKKIYFFCRVWEIYPISETEDVCLATESQLAVYVHPHDFSKILHEFFQIVVDYFQKVVHYSLSGKGWRGDGWREYCDISYAYVYRRARTQRFWGIVPSSRHPSPSFMACVSRHDILSCEFCQMNWDFDRAVTGSLSKLLGAKIMDFLHTPKCFAQFLYLRTHRLCLYVLFSTHGVGVYLRRPFVDHTDHMST